MPRHFATRWALCFRSLASSKGQSAANSTGPWGNSTCHPPRSFIHNQGLMPSIPRSRDGRQRRPADFDWGLNMFPLRRRAKMLCSTVQRSLPGYDSQSPQISNKCAKPWTTPLALRWSLQSQLNQATKMWARGLYDLSDQQLAKQGSNSVNPWRAMSRVPKAYRAPSGPPSPALRQLMPRPGPRRAPSSEL